MRNNLGQFVKGYRYKMSDEHKKKLSKAKKGKKGRVQSKEIREKISLRLKGQHHSPLTQYKIGEFSGDKNPNWQGGINTTERRVWITRRYRLRKLGNGGSHSLDEWETLKAQYNWTCPCCKKFEPEIKLTVDHIIPIAKGGSDNIENIQPLCKLCNCKKHTKNIKYENYIK